MIPRAIRSNLKRILPAPLWIAARRTATYVRRLRIWRAVLSEVEGLNDADKAILRQSFRRGPISALHDLDAWQDPHLIADAWIRVPTRGDFHVRAHSDDLYHVLPSREAEVLKAIEDALKPGSTFVDAGANIGFFTVLAARLVGSTGRVIAIEMMPDTAARLRLHVAANKLSNVVILEHALSDRSGEELTAIVPERKFGRASIVRTAEGEEQHKVTVHTGTMDDLFRDLGGPIDLIKMDLESAELLALRGATEVLSRTKAVIFEQLPGETGAGTLLKGLGFQLRMLDSTNVRATSPRRV
jgi:FkbM family methyltransferase